MAGSQERESLMPTSDGEGMNRPSSNTVKKRKLYDSVALVVTWPYDQQARWVKLKNGGYRLERRYRNSLLKQRWSGWISI
jgi:hypothetical protein